MDSDELIELVRDLYRTSVDNRRFLHTRVLGADVETATYRQLIVEAIYPDPLSQRPVRVAEAERLLRHYRRMT